MAYKNKTYVCFDADNDFRWYSLMQAWNENGNVAFNFHNAHEINNLRDGSSEETIKSKLRKRLEHTKILVVLIGNNTKNLYRFVRWEIEYAIENDIPIVAVNLNKLKQIDQTLCPLILKDKLAIHISYDQKIMNHTLNNWPDFHEKQKKAGVTGAHSYPEKAYSNL